MPGHPRAVGTSRKAYTKVDTGLSEFWSPMVNQSHLFCDSLCLLIMSLLLVSSFLNRDIHRQILRIVCIKEIQMSFLSCKV